MSTALKENYYALAISLTTKKDPDEAMTLMRLRKGRGKYRRRCDKEELDHITFLRESGYTWRLIGKSYGTNASVVQKRYKKYCDIIAAQE